MTNVRKHDPMSVRVDVPKDGPNGLPTQHSGTENVSLAFLLNKWGGLQLASGRYPYDDISALCKALAAKSFLNRYEIVGRFMANSLDDIVKHIEDGQVKREELAAACYLLDNGGNVDRETRILVPMLRRYLDKCVE